MLSRHFRRAHEAKRVTARNQGLPIDEIDVLWLTAGLRCDGCSVAMTAAARPGPMDFRGGRLHRTPKVPLDLLSFNVENGRAAACPVTGAAGPVANESDGPPVGFRSAGSKRFLAVRTHKLAKLALDEPLPNWEESGAWHECEQQNAGGTCTAEKGAYCVICR